MGDLRRKAAEARESIELLELLLEAFAIGDVGSCDQPPPNLRMLEEIRSAKLEDAPRSILMSKTECHAVETFALLESCQVRHELGAIVRMDSLECLPALAVIDRITENALD